MGGSRSSSRSCPSREWFTSRVAAGPEGRRTASNEKPNPPTVASIAPPPRFAYAPTTAGRHATARTAWPPCVLRDIPKPIRMYGARARP